MTSLPSRASGIVISWIGDGSTKPAFSTAERISCDKLSSVNFKCFSFLKDSAKLPYEPLLVIFSDNLLSVTQLKVKRYKIRSI